MKTIKVSDEIHAKLKEQAQEEGKLLYKHIEEILKMCV